MLTQEKKKLRCKLLTLGALVAAWCILATLAPRSGQAQSSYCSYEVYDYCFSQGRPVDPYTCECNMSACLGVPESDCTEQGMYLDHSTCQCVSNPSYIGYCDDDPYALGCPRSFDTVFGNQLRINQGDPLSGGGSGDICSFNSYAWCAINGGWWSSVGCACSLASSNSTAQQLCESNGGAWREQANSIGGPVCFNPTGYGQGSECANPTHTLSSCVSSGGYWNPYKCRCTPEP